MKNLFKKMISSIISMSMIAGTTIATSANAAEYDKDATYQETLEMFDEMTKNKDRTPPFYYQPYDSYDSSRVAQSHHYLAAVAPTGASLPYFFDVYFYLDNTISSNNSADISRFDCNSTFNTIYASMNDYSPSVKSICATFTHINSTILPTWVFNYDLGNVENNSYVTSEYNLHCRTSNNYYSPSSTLPVSTGETFTKIIYSIGDVNRNGKIEVADEQLIQKHILDLGLPFPGRTASDAAIDKIAFELAADIDQNGIIDMSDVLAISSLIEP